MTNYTDNYNGRTLNDDIGADYESTESAQLYRFLIGTDNIKCGTIVNQHYTMRIKESVALFTSQQASEITFVSSASSFQRLGLVLRSSGFDTSHYAYVCAHELWSKNYKIHKCEAAQFDSSGVLNTYTAPTKANNGDRLRAEAITDLITGYVTINFYNNDVLMVTYEDQTSPILSGQPGFLAKFNNYVVYYDDFYAIDSITGTPVSIDFDTNIAVSAQTSKDFDTKVSISNQLGFDFDTKIAVSHLILSDFDTKIGVSSYRNLDFDTQMKISTQIALDFDTLLQVTANNMEGESFSMYIRTLSRRRKLCLYWNDKK